MNALAATLLLLPLLPSKLSHTSGEGVPAPATQPAAQTSPATQPAGHNEVISVHRGNLTTAIDALGYFEPVEPLDVRLRPKDYAGELKIKSIAADGAAVKKGDVLLEIDTSAIDKQIAAAQNEQEAAHATLTRAQADAKLGQQQEQLALKMQTDSTQQAQDEVKWYENVDEPNELLIVDLELKLARDSVEDQQDELDQLKKMYKGDDLTTDTADIVVKRAVRRLELAKSDLKIEEERGDKVKKFIVPAQKGRVLDSATQADQQLQLLKIAQAQSAVLRETGLKTAQANTDAADEKLADLKADREKLVIRAPADGVVVWGQFAGGGFNPVDPHALAAGEHIAPQQVVMTFYEPGKLRLHLDLPEQKFFSFPAGTKAAVTPVAFTDQKIEGTCDPSAGVAINTQQGPQYPTTISLSGVDPKLVPGMRANLHADAPLAENVLLVPSSALADGAVWLKMPDGSSQRRTVVAGKSDGKQTEIRQGINEGDQVFVEAQK